MRPTSLLATTMLLVTATAAQANLVSNGSFEAPAAGGVYGFGNGTGYSYLVNGSTETSDSWSWHKSAGVLDGTAATPWFGSFPPSGYSDEQYAFVQMSGSWIAQDFTLTDDATVTISWAIGSRPPISFGISGATTWSVTAGSLTQTGSTSEGQNFTAGSMTGTLTAGTYTLTFLNTTSDPDADATFFVDNVSVAITDAPEPATMGLMLAGMMSLAGFRRLRR